MVAIANAIIAQRAGSFDPATYRDRYRKALNPRWLWRISLPFATFFPAWTK
jgi:hypothetical protein